MYIAGNGARDDTQIADTQILPDSVIETNKHIITKLQAPIYNGYNKQIWRANFEIQRQWAASFLLPVGSIFILGMVVLLMVLFRRYPHTVAAIVAAILGIIIVTTTMVLLNTNGPIYT